MSRSRAQDLGFGERLALRMIDLISTLYLGYKPPVNEEAFRTLGVRGYAKWSGATGRTMKVLAEGLGEAESQFVIGFSGLWLGCGYCGAGHIHAGNLIVFRDRDVLTPLDDATLHELYDTPDAEAIARIQALLCAPEDARLLGLITRLYELREGAEPTTEDDAYLELALSCWDWVTECTIVVGLEIPFESVPPLTPLAKNRKLLRRYSEARAKASESAD